MKTEIKENEEKNSNVNLLRRGYDHYVPLEQICTFMNVPFEGVRILPKDLEMTITDVKQDDGSILHMECIHIKSLVPFIKWLKEKYTLEPEKTTMFFTAMHKIHINYEDELKTMLEESYESSPFSL